MSLGRAPLDTPVGPGSGYWNWFDGTGSYAPGTVAGDMHWGPPQGGGLYEPTGYGVDTHGEVYPTLGGHPLDYEPHPWERPTPTANAPTRPDATAGLPSKTAPAVAPNATSVQPQPQQSSDSMGMILLIVCAVLLLRR